MYEKSGIFFACGDMS